MAAGIAGIVARLAVGIAGVQVEPEMLDPLGRRILELDPISKNPSVIDTNGVSPTEGRHQVLKIENASSAVFVCANDNKSQDFSSIRAFLIVHL